MVLRASENKEEKGRDFEKNRDIMNSTRKQMAKRIWIENEECKCRPHFIAY